MAAVAQIRQLAVNLMVVGLPEEADRGVEGLGELIARHRPFGQARKDRVTQRHANTLHFGARLHLFLDTICTKVHMRQCAYGWRGIEPWTGPMLDMARPHAV